MDQDWLVFLDSILYEFVYSFSRCIFGVEDNLIFQVEPLECQINNSSTFPVILHLLPRTVDDVRNFVGHHKLLILLMKSKNE